MRHLMRGVALGLFDEPAAHQKFEDWNGQHEQLVAQRDEAHRKHKSEKRNAVVQESVQKVEERMAARAAAAKPVEEVAAPEEAVAETADNGGEATAEA